MSEAQEIPVMPWLQGKADQVLARMREEIGKAGLTPKQALSDYNLVMMPLAEPREGASREEIERFEYTCDNCGAYCPPPFVRFTTGVLAQEIDGVRVLLSWGACVKCTEANP